VTAPSLPAVRVRPARPEELVAAGEVVLRAYTADGHDVGGYATTLLDAADRSRDAEVVVAVDDAGRVLGSVTFAPAGSRWAELAGPGEAEFRMLGVDPGHRGRGIGVLLVEWCLDRARQTGSTALVLCSMDEMTTAHGLYDRLGFSRRPDLDWVPEPGVRLLGFHRPLP
jgi:ribosomal protein S18 acetylase RimI-like enzyme